MKCCSFLNPNYGCQVYLDIIVNKNLAAALASPQQCPNVHGEVRGHGLCDDISSFFPACLDAKMTVRISEKMQKSRSSEDINKE